MAEQVIIALACYSAAVAAVVCAALGVVPPKFSNTGAADLNKQTRLQVDAEWLLRRRWIDHCSSLRIELAAGLPTDSQYHGGNDKPHYRS
jgi:hypothetical protein